MINYGVTSEIASRYSVSVAPTTLFITSSFVEPYNGPRTASGVTSAARTAYLRHSKAETAAATQQLGGPGRVERLSEACLDVVLLNTSAAFMLEVSTRWPASPALGRAAAEGDLRVSWSSDPALAQRLGMKLRPGVSLAFGWCCSSLVVDVAAGLPRSQPVPVVPTYLYTCHLTPSTWTGHALDCIPVAASCERDGVRDVPGRVLPPHPRVTLDLFRGLGYRLAGRRGRGRAGPSDWLRVAAARPMP